MLTEVFCPYCDNTIGFPEINPKLPSGHELVKTAGMCAKCRRVFLIDIQKLTTEPLSTEDEKVWLPYFQMAKRDFEIEDM
jgi:hypothetical protein